jgi:hypothetical protein
MIGSAALDKCEEAIMKRIALMFSVVLLLGAGAAQAQVAIGVRVGPPPRYWAPARPLVYRAVPVRIAPVPLFVARPVGFCGPYCREEIRERRSFVRHEFVERRAFIRHEAFERHERWENRYRW